MDFKDNKLEISIAVLAFVAIAGLFKVFGSFGGGGGIINQIISYEMPRPKNDIVGEFGLNGREIDRRYVNPFAKKKTADAKPVEAPKAAQVVKKAPARKTAATKKASDAKGPKTSINVVDRDESRMAHDPMYNGVDSRTLNRAGLNGAGIEGEVKKDVLSPNQWRALMSAEPTRANMDKMVAAVNANELDQATFYAILAEMLKSQKSDDQTVAMYGLQKVTTVQSFSMVASEYENLPESIQPSAKQYLEAFSGKNAILAQALTSSDFEVQKIAAEVVKKGLSGTPNGGTINPRDVRGENQAQGASSYVRITQIFQAWAASSDAALQSIAAEMLPLLPTTQASL